MVEASKPPETTREEDLTTSGQRSINRLWEYTQSFIAIMVTAATTIALFIVAIGLRTVDNNGIISLMQLVGMTLLILGFYYSRTNHTKVGGTGSKITKDGFDKER